MAEEVGTYVSQQIGEKLLQKIIAFVPSLAYLDPWVFFVVMLVAAVVLSQLVAYVFRVVVKAITMRTKTDIDDIILAHIQQPIAWIIFSFLVYIAFVPLSFSNGLARFIDNSLIAINVIVFAFLVHRFVSAIFEIWQTQFASKTESVLDDTMLPILSKFMKASIWIIAFLTILGFWGFEIAPFLAGLGIAGIAIGFAVKDSLANIFGGISLALDHAYKVGDKIRLESGVVGVVNDISLRSTQIRTYDGDLVMVPNGKVATENLYTFARPAPKSRGQINFGVEYGSDIEKVKRLVLEVLNGIEKIESEPEPAVWFINMGAYALEMRAYFWLNNYQDVWSTEREATDKIYAALNKSKIGIPFPTQTLHIKKS